MSQELLPQAQASRAQVLQAEIATLRAAILRLAGKIEAKGDVISSLIGTGKDDERALHVAERTALVVQQNKLEEQQKLAQAELTTVLGAVSQPTEIDWLHKVLEGLTLKMDNNARELAEKVGELAENSRELAEKVENATRPLPKAVDDNLEKMLFAVLDKDAQDGTTRNPVGVSFFVRPKLAVTAYHVLSKHYSKTIAIGATVYLSREAGLPDFWIGGNEEMVDGPNLIETMLVRFDVKEDWALMKLAKPTQDIIPFEIAKVTEAKDGACQMLNFNIHLGMEEDILPQISMSRVDFRNFSTRLLSYTCTAYTGDSGGAVIVSKTGKVVAMHCELVNRMKGTEGRVQLKEASEELNDFHSEVSSGHVQAVFEGIRLDYLEEQGHFAGF